MRIEDVILANRYVDEELGGEDRQAFENRLEAEPPLSGYVRGLRNLIEACRGDEDFEAPRLRFGRPSVPTTMFFSKRIRLAIFAPAAAVLLFFLLAGPFAVKKPGQVALAPATFRVVYFDPQASSVSVSGDFNNWAAPFPLSQKENTGYWVGEISAAAGEYQYVIVVDNQRWIPDPTADYLVSDDFGATNSVVRVGL